MTLTFHCVRFARERGKETHDAVPYARQSIEHGLRIRCQGLGLAAIASHRALRLTTLVVLLFFLLSQEHRKVKIIPTFTFMLCLPFRLSRRHRHTWRGRCRHRCSWLIGCT